jgi:hypothetical protein
MEGLGAAAVPLVTASIPLPRTLFDLRVVLYTEGAIRLKTHRVDDNRLPGMQAR